MSKHELKPKNELEKTERKLCGSSLDDLLNCGVCKTDTVSECINYRWLFLPKAKQNVQHRWKSDIEFYSLCS